jgi:alcohol dehydrogenase, propanol-preferring
MTKTMRAAVLAAFGQPLDLREMPIPEPGPGEALVKLETCGVCHSDRHVQMGDWPMELPRVLGHEGIGRVVALGPGEHPIAVGDRVGMPALHGACGTCRECITGWEALCPRGLRHGYSVDGCFAEYMRVRSAWVPRIPDSLDAVAAAPLLCAGLTAYGAVRKARLEAGRLAAVFGCGGLGLYAVQLAKMTGARVVAVDVDDAKLAKARALGADVAVRADRDPAGAIRGLGGADACLNFATTLTTWTPMMKALRPGGAVILVAIPRGEVSFAPTDLIEVGGSIRGSYEGGRQELRDLLALAAGGALAHEVEAVPFEGVNAALDRLAAGRVVGRLVIDFTQERFT